MTRQWILPFVVASVVAACSDTSAPSTLLQSYQPTSVAVTSSLIPPDAHSLVILGRKLRDAMRMPETANTVLEAMDESPYVEWRIPLRRVLSGEATTVGALRLRTQLPSIALGDLPELEFYLPFEEQRHSWKGEGPVDIAVRFPHSDDGWLIGADGTEHLIVGGQKFSPSRPMFVLASSEIDYEDYDSAVRGGRRSGSFAGMSPVFARRFEPFAQCQEDCGGGSGGGSGGTTPVYPGDRSQHSRIFAWHLSEDHDFPWGMNELEFYGEVSTHYQGCARYTGIAEDVWYSVANIGDPSNTVAFAVADSTTWFEIQAFEDDDDPCQRRDNDDDLGTVVFGAELFGYGAPHMTPGNKMILNVLKVTP